MFSRFSKIFCILQSFGMVYSNGLQVRKLVRSLPKAWETKVVILEDGDLQKITYDELQGNLMAYEQNHINRYNKDDKKNIVAFTAETSDIGKEIGEYQSERMTLLNRGVKKMLNQRRDLNWNSISMNSKEMMIGATIVEN